MRVFLRAGHNPSCCQNAPIRNFRMRVRVQISEYTDRTVREDIMKRALTASVVAGTLAIATIATPTSAQAQLRGWGFGPRWLGARPVYWGGAIAASLCLRLWLPGLFLWLRPRLRLREFWLWLRSRRLRELWLRLSCLQLRQLRLSGIWLWRRLLPASLSLRLLRRLSTSLPSHRLRRLSGGPPRCDPPRSLALSRLSGNTYPRGTARFRR